MVVKKTDLTKDPAASLAELEKSVGVRPRKAETASRPAAERAASTRPAQLKIRLVRSGICTPQDQKQTLAGLGLRRLRQEVVRADTTALRGMILKVRHLVEVSPASK